MRLLIFHGLNNNATAFDSIRMEFAKLGYETEQIILPGHGGIREENFSFDKAYAAFARQMEVKAQAPYVAIGFSTGALYLQLWTQRTPAKAPLAQVLLAPALFARNAKPLSTLFRLLPKNIFIPSQTPPKLRRYDRLFIWEYRTLFEAMERFKKEVEEIKCPTMVIMDPKDELVDEIKLKKNLPKKIIFHSVKRPYLKGMRPGKYHIIFHPDYLSEEHWKWLLKETDGFFKSSLAA